MFQPIQRDNVCFIICLLWQIFNMHFNINKTNNALTYSWFVEIIVTFFKNENTLFVTLTHCVCFQRLRRRRKKNHEQPKKTKKNPKEYNYNL